jgi:hypothetical protein
MSFVNKTNHQYIQGRVASKQGVTCQGGGGHNYDNDALKSSYGFTQEGANLASELRGSYPAVTPGVTRHNQCGGKKKKRKSHKKKRKSRKKKRKSRKKKRTRKTKRRRKSRRKKTKKRRRKKYKGGNCNFKLNKYNKHGGAYSQYGSNEPNSPTYSFEPTTTKPWALGPGNFKRNVNKF